MRNRIVVALTETPWTGLAEPPEVALLCGDRTQGWQVQARTTDPTRFLPDGINKLRERVQALGGGA